MECLPHKCCFQAPKSGVSQRMHEVLAPARLTDERSYQNPHSQNLVWSHALLLLVLLESARSSSWWGIKELMVFWNSHFSQKGMRNYLEATQSQWQRASLKNWVVVLIESIRTISYFRHHSLETAWEDHFALIVLFPLFRKIYTSPQLLA